MAVGSFDGVHLGHRAILEILINKARANGVPSAVVTFEPHPRKVTRSEDVGLLTPLEEKVAAFSALGVDYLVILKFDECISKMSFEDFVKYYLTDSLGMSILILGEDHGFGKNRAGDAGSLAKLGSNSGFEIEIVPPVKWKDVSIRSNRIRKSVSSGEMLDAAHMLGRPYSIYGEVVGGMKRGRKLGFPTVNIEVPTGKLLPPFGVYAAAEKSGNPGLLYLGKSPTFGEGRFSVEFHGLEKPSADVGDDFALSVFERFRTDIAFASPQALVEQMEKDLAKFKTWLDQNKIENTVSKKQNKQEEEVVNHS